MTRWVLHADMDAFYASIEQRDNPELRGKPVIVGATSARGVVAAASYEARTFGVRSAMPGFRARALCPHGIFLRPNMARYAEASEQIHAIFGDFTSEIEPLALDEAFLEITGSVRLFGGPLALARELKRRVRERMQLTVSVGLAPSKLVAKIACRLSKPDGLLVVPEEAVRWLLDPLPVRQLWGVGPVAERSLVDVGIQTIGDLAHFDAAKLKALLGNRAAELQELARGEDRRGVSSDREPKSIGEENTFEHDVLERDTIASTLTAHAETVAGRLRRAGYRARTITLKAKLGRHRGRRESRTGEPAEPVYPLVTRQTSIQEPTDDGGAIRAIALKLWDELALREPVRLIGISASSLERRAKEQLDLFDWPAGKRARQSGNAPAGALGPALDAIQRKFGKNAIRRAVGEPEKVTPSLHKKHGE